MEALGNAFQQSSEEILEDIRNQVAIEADIAGHADDDLKPAAKDADEADIATLVQASNQATAKYAAVIFAENDEAKDAADDDGDLKPAAKDADEADKAGDDDDDDKKPPAK